MPVSHIEIAHVSVTFPVDPAMALSGAAGAGNLIRLPAGHDIRIGRDDDTGFAKSGNKALMAREEGILSNPICSDRGFSGPAALIRRGRWTKGQKVVFAHTDGAFALFAYGRLFCRQKAT